MWDNYFCCGEFEEKLITTIIIILIDRGEFQDSRDKVGLAQRHTHSRTHSFTFSPRRERLSVALAEKARSKVVLEIGLERDSIGVPLLRAVKTRKLC